MQGRVIVPRGHLPSFEAVRQLLVSHQCLLGFLRPYANQWKMEIVCEESNRVQNDPLFSVGASQDRVDLVDDKHAYFELTSEHARSLPERGDTLMGRQEASHAY